MVLTGWVWLVVLGAVAAVGLLWWRRRAARDAAANAKPRERRRGPRRVRSSRRESFRMGDDDNDRRGERDRRAPKPGWDDSRSRR